MSLNSLIAFDESVPSVPRKTKSLPKTTASYTAATPRPAFHRGHTMFVANTVRFLTPLVVGIALMLPLSLVSSGCEDAVKKNAEKAQETKKKASTTEA